MNSIEIVHRSVSNALESLAALFVPEMRLTFIARLPGSDTSDIVVTNDSHEELARVIQRTVAIAALEGEGDARIQK